MPTKQAVLDAVVLGRIATESAAAPSGWWRFPRTKDPEFPGEAQLKRLAVEGLIEGHTLTLDAWGSSRSSGSFVEVRPVVAPVSATPAGSSPEAELDALDARMKSSSNAQALLHRALSGRELSPAALALAVTRYPKATGWLAGNQRTPAVVLTELAKHETTNVRTAVAWNKATPVEAVIEMALTDPFVEVKAATLRNPKLPESAALLVAATASKSSRWLFARTIGGKHITSATLQALWNGGCTAEDGWASRLEERILGHRNCPPEVLDDALNRGGWRRCSALRAPALALDRLVKVAETSKDPADLAAVAANPSLPFDQFAVLASHSDAAIRREALASKRPFTDAERAILWAAGVKLAA